MSGSRSNGAVDPASAELGPEEIWTEPTDRLLSRLATTRAGLATAEVQSRLTHYGPNTAAAAKRSPLWLQFLVRFRNPLVIILLVLTSFLEDERVLPAIQAGAAGYLLKNVAPAELARAIRAAHAGEAMIDPTAAARLVHAIADDARPRIEEPERLTRRERDVLELIARGRSNKRIALELGISEKTVKTHVGHLLAKLGVTDRTQAALMAVEEGLVGPRP